MSTYISKSIKVWTKRKAIGNTSNTTKQNETLLAHLSVVTEVIMENYRKEDVGQSQHVLAKVPILKFDS